MGIRIHSYPDIDCFLYWSDDHAHLLRKLQRKRIVPEIIFKPLPCYNMYKSLCEPVSFSFSTSCMLFVALSVLMNGNNLCSSGRCNL
jgi:hypothetical protein